MTALPRPSQILLVGQKIRQIRKSRRLTQADLAGRIGVTQSDLSRMENGEYKVGLDTLFKLLQIFELSMSTFFEEPVEVAEIPEPVASPTDHTVPTVAQETLLADWADLTAESQLEVRDFIAFKRQQEIRQQRWKPDTPDGTEGEEV